MDLNNLSLHSPYDGIDDITIDDGSGLNITHAVKGPNGTEEDREPEDRISELPDAIIIQILSFLPTIVVVRTSLFSKRWRHVWTLVPVLDFSDSREVEFFRRPNEKNNERKKFFKFVDECLKHPYADTTITKFKLEMDFYGGGHRVDGWLRFPVIKSVKELDLHVSPTRSIYYLPNAILSIRTLTLLKLNGLQLNGFPIVSLPSLKVLYIKFFIMNDKALNNLLLGCPYLEKLDIRG
ncbi:LRR domain containing protein [Parasponia andersonii]|uniref:LRR domain containing protein n=1 Tax=Parasponia andersonii TaxID=3476 RepID=A0A2P5BB90_PARAD|nr:LRR domain containing protein [Parasponia andersonii]